jgi:hypothetical protein
MLSILGQRGRLCDRLSRRELLTVGGLGLVGLSLTTVLSRQSAARESPRPTAGFGRAKGVILLYLQGSPSHIDLWDPKPAAPTTIRGEFKPITTSVAGISLSETLPRLAQQADKYADLAERGLLAETLVWAIGEFGRSPKIGQPTTNNVGPGGRDHWPECYTCLLAGGGIRGGQVYGESDRDGAYPKSAAVHPYDLIATLYHALGIDPGKEYHTTRSTALDGSRTMAALS